MLSQNSRLSVTIGANLLAKLSCKAAVFILGMLLASLFACAHPSRVAHPDFQAPETTRILPSVPFFPQLMYQCGPASLSGVLQYHGDAIRPHQIAAKIYRSELHGTLSLDLVLFARQRGFTATWFKGSIAEIQRAIDSQTPLIVMVDYGVWSIRKYHFMVIVGYTPEAVVVNSGQEKEKHLSWGRFLSIWEKTDYWTLRILPKGPSPEELSTDT